MPSSADRQRGSGVSRLDGNSLRGKKENARTRLFGMDAPIGSPPRRGETNSGSDRLRGRFFHDRLLGRENPNEERRRRGKFEWETTLSAKIRMKSDVVLAELVRPLRRFNYGDDVERGTLGGLM